MNDPDTTGAGSFSRRTFLKGLGTTAVAAVAAQTTAVAAELEKVNAEKVIGPGAVPAGAFGSRLDRHRWPRKVLSGRFARSRLAAARPERAGVVSWQHGGQL